MLDDLKEIRRILIAALKRFGKTATGEAWDGDLTNSIDPNLCAQVCGSLIARLNLLDPWLTGNWTPMEEVIVLEFLTAWDTAEQTIERYENRYGPEPYDNLATLFYGHGIPDTPIPKRDDPDAATPLVPHGNEEDYSGNVQPGPTFTPAPGPGPELPTPEQ